MLISLTAWSGMKTIWPHLWQKWILLRWLLRHLNRRMKELRISMMERRRFEPSLALERQSENKLALDMP